MNDREESLSVLVADDHDLLVDMLEALLNAKGFRTDRALSLPQVLDRISSAGTFDIVLLDLDMPGMNGLSGVEKVVKANAPGSVVLFSGQARQEAVFRSLEFGVRGYIPKTLPVKSLTNALKFVASGETFIPSGIAANIVLKKKEPNLSVLSQKEIEVLQGICRGETNKDIARNLGLTEILVKMHVRSLCSKLEVKNRTQIAMTAVSRGLF